SPLSQQPRICQSRAYCARHPARMPQHAFDDLRRMYTLYSMQRSGNSYKVRLVLAQLGIPHNRVEIDILKGESRTPDFLAKNPSGRVPLLEVAPGRYLAE